MRTDADDGLENFVLGLESLGVGNDAIHALFEIPDLPFEEGDGFVDVLEDFRRRALSGVAVVFFGSDYANELAPAVAKTRTDAETAIVRMFPPTPRFTRQSADFDKNCAIDTESRVRNQFAQQKRRLGRVSFEER